MNRKKTFVVTLIALCVFCNFVQLISNNLSEDTALTAEPTVTSNRSQVVETSAEPRPSPVTTSERQATRERNLIPPLNPPEPGMSTSGSALPDPPRNSEVSGATGNFLTTAVRIYSTVVIVALGGLSLGLRIILSVRNRKINSLESLLRLTELRVTEQDRIYRALNDKYKRQSRDYQEQTDNLDSEQDEIYQILIDNYVKQSREHQEQVRDLENKIAELTTEHDDKYEHQSPDHQEQVRDLENKVVALKTDYQQESLEEWLTEVTRFRYRKEVEVEVKLIAPMVRYLGYTPEEYDVRVPVKFPAGRRTVTVEADWVIWDKQNRSSKPKARVVIEAKAPSVRLGREAQEQARSYALGLGAPFYLITNGKQVKLFQTQVEKDIRVVDCPISQLSFRWSAMIEAIGASEEGEQRNVL